MKTRTWFSVAAVAASLTVVASTLGAQEVRLASPAPDVSVTLNPNAPLTPGAVSETAVTSAAVSGPHRDAAVVGVRLRAIDGGAASFVLGEPPVVKPGQVRRGTSLGLLGLAAFIAGLAIGKDVGTVMAVGGAVVGIYGLYLVLP